MVISNYIRHVFLFTYLSKCVSFNLNLFYFIYIKKKKYRFFQTEVKNLSDCLILLGQTIFYCFCSCNGQY